MDTSSLRHLRLTTLPRRLEIPLNFPIALHLQMRYNSETYKLPFHPVKKHFIPDINCNRVISAIIAKLSIRHLKGMKIFPDGQRSYNTCSNCPGIQLSPIHILNCFSILAKLHYIDLNAMGHQHSKGGIGRLRRHLIPLHGQNNNRSYWVSVFHYWLCIAEFGNVFRFEEMGRRYNT
ncbi:hypothetical protein TNCV_64331 [Trichonephila clavipes]|nr:hypothetical protein TNCV_64331 [Trichonephila clavipes]